MKLVSILSFVLFLFLFFYVKRTKKGMQLIQHFYFQTFIMLVLVFALVSRLIHFRLNIWSVLAILILSFVLATGLPHYIQNVKKRIRK